jgi:hypothetical protein
MLNVTFPSKPGCTKLPAPYNLKSMRIFLLLVLVLFVSVAQAQSPCDNVKLYDQMIVKGDQPILPKLKRFDIKLIPDSTLLKMKSEIIRLTSAEWYSGLKIKSVKLFDSAVAKAWSWTQEPIVDDNSNPVDFFYSVLFETAATNKTPFVFRLDVLKSGELLNKKQIAFSRKGKLNIIDCKKLVSLVLADTIQPIRSIDHIGLAYSPTEGAVIWTIVSAVDPKTGIQYFKDVNASTGKIINRSFSDLKAPVQLEEVKVQSED